jgi:HAD superfamily hydrolase (TIGR01509 family)
MSSLVTGARPRTVRAVIFDLDGTLIRSEEHYELTDGEFLRRLGIEPTREFFEEVRGMGNGPVFQLLRDRYGVTGTDEELLEMKDRIYFELESDAIDTYAPMMELLQRLHGTRPLAVATGSSPAVLRRVMERTGLGPWFDSVLAADEVGRGKPFPDVFLESARRLGASPEGCLVIEDSASGIEAALRAKMMCIAVPAGEGETLPQLLYSSDLLFPGGPDALSVDMVMEWIDGELT